jgi:hypothetical protein
MPTFFLIGNKIIAGEVVGHQVEIEDQARIKCHGAHAFDGCGRPATVCKYVQPHSFYYYCDEHSPFKSIGG